MKRDAMSVSSPTQSEKVGSAMWVRAAAVLMLALSIGSCFPGVASAVATAPGKKFITVRKALSLCENGTSVHHVTVEGYFVYRPHIHGMVEGALGDRLKDLPSGEQATTNPWPPSGLLDVMIKIPIILKGPGISLDHRRLRVRGILACGHTALQATKFPVVVGSPARVV